MRRRTAILWIAVFAWWTLSGLAWIGQVTTMREAIGETVGWHYVLRTELVSAWLWVPITLGLFWWVRRHPIERGRVLRALIALSLAVAAVIVLRAVAVVALNDWIGWYSRLPSFDVVLIASVLNNLLMSWLIIGVAHALIYADRALQRERQAAELKSLLTQSRLEALSARLNPHFLFNALNSVAELVHSDPDAADHMIVALGRLLRRSLEGSDTQELPLREELRLLDQYVDIEKIRLGERLRFECAADAQALEGCVPSLILQPLVENAIVHVVSLRTTPGQVSVRAHRDEDRLVVEVQDDGAGMAGTAFRHGVGLSNTRARLEYLYGADHLFEVGPGPRGGTLARLVVPYRTIAAAAAA